MQTFKLTPKPQSDFRLEISEIRKTCTLEKAGYRHNKIVYGFCDELLDIAGLQALGLNIEVIPFDDAQLTLANNLIERGRAKSKLAHLQHDQVENGAKNEKAVAAAEQKLTDLNNTIQAAKEALGITGTLRTLKF
jgi:hypothetical protein